MDDLEDFQVTVTYNVKATDRLDAAMKAYALGVEMPPTEFTVKDAAGVGKQVELEREQLDEAISRINSGTMFKNEL